MENQNRAEGKLEELILMKELAKKIVDKDPEILEMFMGIL